MKKIFVILILILLSFGLFAAKPVVAVMEIENKTSGKNRLSNDEAELIADLMRSELIQTNRFDVMSKEEMEEAIAKHVKKSHQLNKDKNYAIELGKQISARYIITSYIKTDGNSFRMFAEMIDTEIGKSPRSGHAKFAKNDDSKDTAIAKLIGQLLGERDESLKSKKSNEQLACEYAKNEDSIEAWQDYLDLFPEGECILTAKSNIRKLKKMQKKKECSKIARQIEMYENMEKDFVKRHQNDDEDKQESNRKWLKSYDKKIEELSDELEKKCKDIE